MLYSVLLLFIREKASVTSWVTVVVIGEVVVLRRVVVQIEIFVVFLVWIRL